MLQEARVPAQAVDAATHDQRVTQRGVEVIPASDVSHHSGAGEPCPKVAALLRTR